MARKENDLTACMITQALQGEYWKLDDNETKIIESNDVTQITNLVVKKLEDAGMVVVEAYGIIHDKDTVMEWDEIEMQEVIAYKTHHVHVIVKFEKSKGGTVTQIANAVGLEPQFIEKPGRGRFAYDNMLSYLIHIKYTDKHQYEPSEVYTARGESYTKIAHERNEDWLKGRAKIQVEKAKIDADWLEEKILTGEVTKQQVMLTDEYFSIYARNKRRMEDAFDSYGQHKIYRTMQKMENGEFKTSVIFVTGAPHSGKSVFTEMLVKSIQKDVKEKTGEVWTVCTCASSNPFDEYQGEEILVMDDLRGMALTASDWLKLLDPDRINMGSARYKNKRMACRTIIINSEKDVIDFFYYTKGIGGDGRSEAMDQFIRRIMAKVVVFRVPDDYETRRLKIGRMEESDAYQIASPDKANGEQLTLHHEFNSIGSYDVEYSDGIKYLSALVMKNNKYDDEETQKVIDTYTDDLNDDLKAELYEDYKVYLDKFWSEHPGIKEPNNCPTFEWFLEQYKRKMNLI